MTDYIGLAATLIVLTTALLICLLSRFIVKMIVVTAASRLIRKRKRSWAGIFFDKKLFHRLANITVPFILAQFTAEIPDSGWLNRVVVVLAIFILLPVFDSLLNGIDEIYRAKEISKIRPIRAILQVVRITSFILAGIVAVAVLAGENPMVLLGGIGAVTAVITLVFKDAILGFVAGIQLTSNDMIRIGDWIEMPKYSADGTVVDLSLTTVKVENFNKTVTSIPAYTLVSDAFINWRHIEAAGGRRIKRSINIDAGGIRLCDDEMLERFRKIALISGYINEKTAEIADYNAGQDADMSIPVNGRRLTNLGVFRAYVTAYLRQNRHIRKDMLFMVRQQEAGDNGLPLEIYAFANTTNITVYETIQADIFDHLYAIIGEFGLQVYQRPSSGDIRSLGDKC